MNRRSWVLAPRWPLFWPVTAPLLAVLLGALVWFLLPERSSKPPWYCAEFTTDNGFHPVHLTDGKAETPCDLVMIRNLSSKPLCVYAFSSRPRDARSPDEVMTSWARWITVSRQAVTVGPDCTWVLKPGDSSRLPFVHGNTWLTCYFEPAAPGAEYGRLPAAQLTESFLGRFQVFYVPSALEPEYLATPQLYLTRITSILAGEVDTQGHALVILPKQDIRGRNGLTATELD